VEGDVLGEEFKGYVFKIMGGQDKQVRLVVAYGNRAVRCQPDGQCSLKVASSGLMLEVEMMGLGGQAGTRQLQLYYPAIMYSGCNVLRLVCVVDDGRRVCGSACN
jgi:hypothetical protein